MAKYLILIYGDEQLWTSMGPDELQAKGAAHGAFAHGVGSGLLGGHELEHTGTATTLRASNGDGDGPTITDGPFLETKEALGGFYVIEAPDLDAAIAHASRLPELTEASGAVEVRPIHENV